jgi:integrase
VSARTDTEAETRAALMVDIAASLESFAGADEIAELLTEAGKARTEKALAVVVEAVAAIASGTTTRANSAIAPMFADFAKEWTTKDLHNRFPDHLRDKDEAEDVQQLRDYINLFVGAMRLPDVTRGDAERVMQALPAILGPRTRRHVAQCMRKILSLAAYPGRQIAANPIPREWMPKIPKSANKAKSTLFPDEDALLVSCPIVLLERRIAYGILAREGMRASELSELRFGDLDLERGRVRLDENKTDDPTAWALSPDVVRVLTWWKKRQRADDTDRVLSLDLTQGPRWLRGKTWQKKSGHKDETGDLRTAGVTRAELFGRSPSLMPIRLHDLRGTFVTVSLANGKTEQWVSDRTGHKSSQMLALYSRQARTWAELDLGALRPLDELLPEMQPTAADPLCSDWAANSSHRDSPCFTVAKMIHHEASRRSVWSARMYRVPAKNTASSEAVTTSGDALHLAIKLAVEAREYVRAGALLDVLRRTTNRRGS